MACTIQRQTVTMKFYTTVYSATAVLNSLICLHRALFITHNMAVIRRDLHVNTLQYLEASCIAKTALTPHTVTGTLYSSTIMAIAWWPALRISSRSRVCCSCSEAYASWRCVTSLRKRVISASRRPVFSTSSSSSCVQDSSLSKLFSLHVHVRIYDTCTSKRKMSHTFCSLVFSCSDACSCCCKSLLASASAVAFSAASARQNNTKMLITNHIKNLFCTCQKWSQSIC